MARPGLEPGTPRFSVVRSRYLNPTYFQGFLSFSQRLRRPRLPGLCVRLPGVTADGRARLPFRWAGDLLLRSVIAVAIALVPTSWLAGPPTSASAARTPGASRGRRRAPAAREGSCVRLAGPWPFAALLGWHLASCGPVVMHEANTARDSSRVSDVLRGGTETTSHRRVPRSDARRTQLTLLDTPACPASGSPTRGKDGSPTRAVPPRSRFRQRPSPR